MIENLIKKVVEDAEKKARSLIEKAEKELEGRYRAEKENTDAEYANLLQSEKAAVDRESEREISNLRMEKEKELLALKNSFIDEVVKKIEERFNAYLREHKEDVVKSLGGRVDGTVKFLDDSIVVEGKNWKLPFNWDKIRTSFEAELREKIAGRLWKKPE